MQTHRCPIDQLVNEDDRQAIVEQARDVLDNWHEDHAFDPQAFDNPVLMKAVLGMYSDAIATLHEAELVEVLSVVRHLTNPK